MKRGLFVVCLFILLTTNVFAQEEKIEDFNNYQSLEMFFSFTSGMDLIAQGGKEKIESIQTDVSFFPRETNLQSVTNLKTTATSDPKIAEHGGKLRYTWKNVKAREIDFGVEATVTTKHMIGKIRKQLRFPITGLKNEQLQFTKSTKFIDMNDAIEQQAYDIIGNEDDLYKVVFKLADWTKSNIKYDLNTLTAEAVQKSSWVLTNREGVCDEMTNLFISFVRSVGIPARFVSGMVYTNIDYDWGPHGWAEVYFPEYGWIPFDVTFGQYGWVDASHIKLKESDDSGSPSAEFSWRASGIELKPKELMPKTTLVGKGPLIRSPLQLTVDVARKNVGPGSKVPLLVTAENTEDYYVSSGIIVRKAPELVGSNVKEVLLGPGETKTVGFLLDIPADLEEGFMYSGMIEVMSTFADSADAKVNYAIDYPIYKEAEARRILANLEEREEKQKLGTVDISCQPTQELFYANETIKIDCAVRNRGTTERALKLCARESCQDVSFGASESKDVSFGLSLERGGRIPITAEDARGVVSTYVEINTVKIPELYLSDVSHDTVNFGDDVTLAFTINSDTELRDLQVDFVFGQLSLETFEGARKMTLETNGKSLRKGLTFEASFTDEKGKQHQQKMVLPVKVVNIPWYAKMVYWFADLF